MLKILISIILSSSFIFGCLIGLYGVDEDFAREADRGKQYQHPTKGDMDLEEDKKECVRMALDKYPKKRPIRPYRTGRFGSDNGYDYKDDNEVDRRMEYKSCMRAKGWKIHRKRK